jgi:hypothetical protein
MASVAKALILSSFMCHAALATTCEEPSDKTSLVQVKQLVQPGKERIPNVALGDPTPVTNYDAISASTPAGIEAGKVMDAFGENSGKIRDEIEAKAADAIDFTSQERATRKLNRENAQDAMRQVAQDAAQSIQADRQAVAEVAAQRAVAVKRATDRVKAAKEKKQAYNIKRLQAEHAAILGRTVGTREGADAANYAWITYKKDMAKRKAAMRRAFLKARRIRGEMLGAAAVNRGTEALAVRADLLRQGSHRMAKARVAGADARSAMAQTRIEGPEGLKNTLTNVKADWAAKNYGIASAIAQRRTDAAASGAWPYTDWPLGP